MAPERRYRLGRPFPPPLFRPGTTNGADMARGATTTSKSETRPTTLGELRDSGYEPRTIREELRTNLIAKMRSGEDLFPGVYGYETTVIPAIENAILSGH